MMERALTDLPEQRNASKQLQILPYLQIYLVGPTDEQIVRTSPGVWPLCPLLRKEYWETDANFDMRNVPLFVSFLARECPIV